MTLILILWVVPILLSGYICQEKHRSVAKGVFLGIFFGWFAVIGLWLALKTRDPVTRQLS